MTEPFVPAATYEAIDHYKRLAMGKKAFAFCASLSHAKETARAFNRAGISAASITASDGAHERWDTLAAFLRPSGELGGVDVLCGVNALSDVALEHGVLAEVVILMRPTASAPQHEREISTSRAPHIVIDMVGNTQRVTLPRLKFEPRVFIPSFVDKMTPVAPPVSPNTSIEIIVDVKNEILGDSTFWRGPPERIREIRNIPARETAALVAKDGQKRVYGMWHVRAERVDRTPEQIMRWLERHHTLHMQVQALYTADGYLVEITWDDARIAGPWKADTLQQAYAAAMDAFEWDRATRTNKKVKPC